MILRSISINITSPLKFGLGQLRRETASFWFGSGLHGQPFDQIIVFNPSIFWRGLEAGVQFRI
jgi:hypothetical protein